MQNLTSSIYYNECESTANYIVTLAIEALESDDIEVTEDNLRDVIFDYLLHEQIDSHQYTIYYAYHLPILQFSSNDEYAISEFGSEYLADELNKNGLTGLHAALVYYAFYADVREYLDDAINEVIDALEESED